MKEENPEVKGPSPFDLYFDSCEDEFIIKLYEVPRIPGRKAAKEWIEDFENEKPSEEYIASFYGAGHYWVMGTDKTGKIKSKDIHISDRAVQRILKRKGAAAPVAYNPVPQLAGATNPQNIDGVVAVLEKLMTGVIAPLIQSQNKPASPVAQLEEYSTQMMRMFQKNMEMMNTQLMGFSKKIAQEHLQPAHVNKDDSKDDQAPSWIRDLIGGVKPYVDNFLEAQGMKAEIMKQELKKEPALKSILDDDIKLNQFFNGMADDPEIGEEKAVEVFRKFGFDPIWDNNQGAPADTQPINNNEAATKTA